MMKIWHRAVVLLASLMVVATLTGIVGRAATAITTPNAAAVNYTLGAGGTSTTVTPASNQPVLVLGSNNGTTDYGAGTVTLIHIPSTSLRWVGLEAGTGASTHNGSSALGTHIVWLDNNNKVDLQVYSADAFVIHNASTTSQSGTVKLIW